MIKALGFRPSKLYILYIEKFGVIIKLNGDNYLHSSNQDQHQLSFKGGEDEGIGLIIDQPSLYEFETIVFSKMGSLEKLPLTNTLNIDKHNKYTTVPSGTCYLNPEEQYSWLRLQLQNRRLWSRTHSLSLGLPTQAKA